jgi:hypothetical protein
MEEQQLLLGETKIDISHLEISKKNLFIYIMPATENLLAQSFKFGNRIREISVIHIETKQRRSTLHAIRKNNGIFILLVFEEFFFFIDHQREF